FASAVARNGRESLVRILVEIGRVFRTKTAADEAADVKTGPGERDRRCNDRCLVDRTGDVCAECAGAREHPHKRERQAHALHWSSPPIAATGVSQKIPRCIRANSVILQQYQWIRPKFHGWPWRPAACDVEQETGRGGFPAVPCPDGQAGDLIVLR